MRKSHENSASKRSAFTLIEVLVTIAIIGILAGLLLGAVMGVRRWIPVSRTQNDILQISTAVNTMSTKYGGFYPPNRLRLCSNRSTYTTNPSQLDPQSIAAITKIFPSLGQSNAAGASFWTGITWDGTNNTALDVTLEGDQVLVFLLGGIPNGAGQAPLGFSTNPLNPAAPPTAANPDRIKWMTPFVPSRIVLLHNNNFPSYLDGFAADQPPGKKQPYLYFSSMSLVTRENGYDPTSSAPPGIAVSPYVQQATAPVNYWNSKTFQIISAGADGTFGPGGLWPPANGTVTGPVADDMSNFNKNKLGSPD